MVTNEEILAWLNEQPRWIASMITRDFLYGNLIFGTRKLHIGPGLVPFICTDQTEMENGIVWSDWVKWKKKSRVLCYLAVSWYIAHIYSTRSFYTLSHFHDACQDPDFMEWWLNE